MNDNETEEMDAHHRGYRLGTFDKCNGVARRVFENLADTEFNTHFLDGYADGYESNEVRINA